MGLLVAILLPAIASAQAAARTITCGANVRQLCQALHIYATANGGFFPPTVSGTAKDPKPKAWHDADRIGGIVSTSMSDLRGPVATCPEDDDAQRSYAMNLWASSAIDKPFRISGTGSMWKWGTRGASKLILISEAWSGVGSAKLGWVTQPMIGESNDTPGHRFGGGSGLVTRFNANRWGSVNCQLPYMRHRARKGPGRGTEPIGRVQIGYADGHVALKSNADLVDQETGLSTLDTWWSPMDPQLNR